MEGDYSIELKSRPYSRLHFWWINNIWHRITRKGYWDMVGIYNSLQYKCWNCGLPIPPTPIVVHEDFSIKPKYEHYTYICPECGEKEVRVRQK